ncbi:MAG: hypothetical protein KF861_17285 [Planctomycetaceae bacterium]|nr:hypothetical protein [Planctomycetaceae bacterium]
MSSRLISEQEVVRSAHREAIGQEIIAWREWWGELCEFGNPHFGEMGDRLSALRQHLAVYFTQEKGSGSEAERAGRASGTTANRMREEQGALLAELDDLIARLHCREPDFESWSQARDEFEEILDRLLVSDE